MIEGTEDYDRYSKPATLQCPRELIYCKFCLRQRYDSYCKHPVFDCESFSSIPYCPFQKYTAVYGKWIWDEDLQNYINHIVMRLELLDICAGDPTVNSSMLEEERQKLHDIILEGAREERGSEWETKFKDFIENHISKMRGVGADDNNDAE